jgi:hypothetical protein
MRISGEAVRLLVAWCVVGPCAGVLACYLIFFLPVIFGQPMESMIGWGWITTLPAMAGGIFVAGKACTTLLAHWNLCPKWRSSILAGCVMAAVASGISSFLAFVVGL